MPKKIMPGSVMYSRCETLAKKYQEEGASWDELMKQDPLMMYSSEFMKCVADMCNVDPDTGEPSTNPTNPEPKPEPEPEHEQETDGEPEMEPEESEETEEDEEPEEVEEADEGEVCQDEPVPMSWDMCHWCQQEPAESVVFTQVQTDSEQQRLMRCDHLCRECANKYWDAVRQVQYACMSQE